MPMLLSVPRVESGIRNSPPPWLVNVCLVSEFSSIESLQGDRALPNPGNATKFSVCINLHRALKNEHCSSYAQGATKFSMYINLHKA